MNWEILANSYSHIVARIVRFAAKNCEPGYYYRGYYYRQFVHENDQTTNSWMARIQELGQVCSQWKVAILASHRLYKSVEECTVYWDSSNIALTEETKNMIDDGYMIKKLEINDISIDDVDFICNADDNQIEEFSFLKNFFEKELDESASNQWLMKVMGLFGKSKKAHIFNFEQKVHHTEEQRVFLSKLRCAAADCNRQPKETSYIVGFAHTTLYIRCSPAFTGFSRVYFQKSRKTAQCLGIQVLVTCGVYEQADTTYRFAGWRLKFDWARLKIRTLRLPSVETVDFTVIFQGNKTFVATFECDAFVWERVCDWTVDVEVTQN